MTQYHSLTASIWRAWHDDDAQSYDPAPYVAPSIDETRRAIADRIASISSAVTSGRSTVDEIARAIVDVLASIDDAPADLVGEITADVLASHGIDGDDVLPTPASDDLYCADDEYRASDDSLANRPRPAFPTTEKHPVRPHTGRTIRGRRMGIYVVGEAPAGLVADSDDDARRANLSPRARRQVLEAGRTFARIDADDALAIANGFGIDALLGTDDYAWHQVVAHKPERFAIVTNDGRQVVFVRRPDGAGDSIAGAGDLATTRRRRAPYVLRMPTYRRTAVATSTREIDGRTWQVSHYRTTHDGRSIVAGLGRGWESTTRRKRALVVRQVVAPTTREHASDVLASLAKNDGRGYSHRWVFVDGTTVTVKHEPEHRRWRVVISHRTIDGQRVRLMTTTRRLATAVDKVRTAPVSVAP